MNGWMARRFLLIPISLMLVFCTETATAAITALQAWSNVYHGQSTSAQNVTYPIASGSRANRELVVAIATSRTSVGSRSVTLTYGGQALVSRNGDMASTTQQQHTQIYILGEAGIQAATDTTLSVTVSDGTTQSTDIFAAVFDGVDQAVPVWGSATYNSGTTAVSSFGFPGTIAVMAGGQGFEIISSVRTGSDVPRTITYAPNWTMAAQQTATSAGTYGIRNAMANRAIPTSYLLDSSSGTLNGTSLVSMTGISLVAAPTKTDQTIGTIGFSPATLAVSGTTTASATATSGLPVTYTSNTTSVCTVSGTNGATVTGLTAGTCTIAANQAGDATRNPAPTVTQNITVNKGTQATLTVNVSTSSAVYGQTGVTATASGGSGSGAVTYSAGGTACSIDSGTGGVTITSGTGTCSITANKAADTNSTLAIFLTAVLAN